MPAPPKLDPARRNPRVGVLHLPAAGRQGDPPRWPLPVPASKAEIDAWRQLWATPQAHAWELLGWTRTVARYCRIMVECEFPGAKAADRAQATALEDRLGLTPKAMRLLLWVITPDEVAAQREQQSGPGVRGRIRAVG